MTRLEQNSRWRGRIIRYAPLLIWIGVIFYLSSGDGAMTQTSRFIGPLLQYLFPEATPQTIQQYHGYIRKFAHFAEYAAVAAFAARAFYTSSVNLLREHWFTVAAVLVLVIATLDEVNQSFDPSRTGSVTDVLLDCIGGLTALTVIYLFTKLFKKAENITD